MRERLVLVGNGMAGVRTLEELIKLAPDLYAITVFGDEPYGNYNRILLSPVLAAEKELPDIMLNDRQWYQDNNIALNSGEKIARVERKTREVITTQGQACPYDRLIIATGSKPFVIPIPGHDKQGLFTFRDIADVNNMLAAVKLNKKAVVIGGGLLGLEAANGLLKQGMDVTVVHLLDHLMEKQLDPIAAQLLQNTLAASGIKFLMNHQSEAIVGNGRVEGVRFKNGSQIAADLVVMAVGITPNIELAKDSGIHCDRGIVVNDTMQTFDPRIYAVGECVQHRNTTYGLVAPLFEQAKVCANQLARLGYASYTGSVISTKLKVTGIDLFSAGAFQGGPDCDELIYKDAAQGIYKKLVLQNNAITGAVLYGDTIDSAWYFQLMRDGADISDLRAHLIFGESHLGNAGHGQINRVANLRASAEICGCNGISKGEIVTAITAKGLFTVDDVRLHTKASSSCGSCTGLVEQLLAITLGGDFSTSPEKKALCGCTSYSHKEVRQTIREHGLKTIAQVTQFLEWKTGDGCNKCRPALNYYLVNAWPGEYVDDYRSRFINERAHANIQADGTYSIVPRMWGGMTTPKELRAIAEVAEKYQVPAVKITGGQRIDLLGIEKQTLPEIWGDLSQAGFVSGHAYGKAMRTVKTCVGSQWCRFGTQDSIGMGIKLEQMAWGAWTPHKFKMAVSGCPRNCAEATIKDFGLVAVDSGWEIHIGGNGGVKVRVTDLLCKVASEQQALEYAAAFLQLYCEDANYLERTAPWVERVGLSYIKQRLIEDEDGRRLLAERFKHAQQYVQHDPWKQRAQGYHANEFKPVELTQPVHE